MSRPRVLLGRQHRTVAEGRTGVRDLLRAEGLEERVGYSGRRASVADVLESFLAPAASRSTGEDL